MGRRSLAGRRSLVKVGRRKVQFIDAKQQLWFALTLFLYAIMATILFLWVTLLPDASLVEGTVGESFLPPILQQFLALCIQNWWSVFFTFLFLASCALLFSHQIFGPMRRFENTLLQKRKNPSEPVSCDLRKADYFQRFADFLDEFLNETEATDDSESQSGD